VVECFGKLMGDRLRSISRSAAKSRRRRRPDDYLAEIDAATHQETLFLPELHRFS